MSLDFDESKYEVITMEAEGQKLTYRAFEHIPYCTNPKDRKFQCLSIFVPESFYHDEKINGYSLETAPIFFPNTVGGYMPGPEERPGPNFMNKTNATFFALLHGYVVVSSGVRGRTMKDENGKFIGCSPAHIVDLKAAVRYLKHNRNKIPGDVEKIISNGTSAGGAISSLLGSTGNHADYEPFLKEIGAAEADDSVFASSCYCPITNLDHADMAYEWEFNGINDYHRMKIEGGKTEDKAKKLPPKFIPVDEMMTDEQIKLSALLKPMFTDYLNSLELRDDEGTALTLDKDGNGSFKEYIKANVIKSIKKEMDGNKEFKLLPWIKANDGRVTDIDWEEYIKFRTRMKETPAFDNVCMGTPENELFGTPDLQYQHFTSFSTEHSKVNGKKAEERFVKYMNPMYYIEDKTAKKARHFRIRHGAVDRDTSLAISTMLVLKLKNQGIDAELFHPWGIPHAGDYDLPELFKWIDSICK